MSHIFSCFLCQGTFNSAWSIDESLTASEILYGGQLPEELAEVCNDCLLLVQAAGFVPTPAHE